MEGTLTKPDCESVVKKVEALIVDWESLILHFEKTGNQEQYTYRSCLKQLRKVLK